MTRNIQNKTPCKHRYKIYETNLLKAFEALRTLAKDPEYKAMQIALKDKGLMIALAGILDEYVICGVSADLGRCRHKLEKRPSTPPNLNTIIDLSDEIDFEKLDKSKRIKKLYENYFDWFIFAKEVEQKDRVSEGDDQKEKRIVEGLTAFYERYPRIKHAVETLCTNFVNNIREACARLAQDWDTVHQYFFASDPAMSRLVKITPTGSDFHKGGKQVLILTLKIDNVEHRLIYKPGDIQLDYLLLADTTGIRNNPFDSMELGKQKSIWELTNEFLDDDYKLLTYKILPRNPGSQLDKFFNISDRLPIEESYGYIEYLSYSPKPKGYNAPVRMPDESDWITSDKRDVEKFYRQWGRILAIAFMFSMSDIHLDNVIVHKLQPHLIDAEIAFTGPMDDVTGTVALKDTTGALRKEAFKSPKSIRQRDREEERTANLFVYDEEAMQLYEPSKNRLYLANNGTSEMTLAENYIELLCVGFSEVLQAFRVNTQILLSWLGSSNLDKVVARFTPMPTANFSKILRLIYSPKYSSDELFFDKEPFLTKKDEANQDWQAQVGTKWPAPRPNHAIFTEDHIFKDYRKCDIPAFYHRLGAKDLLNARGEIVKIPTGNVHGREHYFPESTLSIVEQKIALLDSIDIIDFTADMAQKLIDNFAPGTEVSGLITSVFSKEL